jgi:hypothetical protein
MSLLQYIQGVRKGKEAHRLEREAMHDPFLADALEGYDKVKGNHASQIKALQRKVSKKSYSKGNNHLYYWSMAANILILISIGSYILFHQLDLPNEPVLADQIIAITETDIPDAAPENIKKSIRFTPPVIARDEEYADAKIVQAEIQQSDNQADLAEITSNRQTDDVTLPVDTGNSISSVSPAKPENFNDYVKRSLIHPADEECKDVKGNVTLCFYVNANGRPYDITIKKSLCPSADKEAIRLVEQGPDWSLTDKEVTKKISF